MVEGRQVERHVSPQELAKQLGVSVDSIRRAFASEPGVIRIGAGARKRLRIPERVAQAWIARQAVEGRG